MIKENIKNMLTYKLQRIKERPFEFITKLTMIFCALVAVITTIGIILSILFESFAFFSKYSILDFTFGLNWSPQSAFSETTSGSFGIIPLLIGTLLITFIALLVAVPIGLLCAIYLSEFASKRVRSFAKPGLEILAGIPTVVYGFIAILLISPSIRTLGEFISLDVSSESALAAGLVMGVMIIPFVSSLAEDAIHAVPQSLRDGSYGLGATQAETVIFVVFPAALAGIMGSIILAFSRAIGETMIVVMAAGLSASLTINPLDAVTTITVQIVNALVGDQEFDSLKTLSAFALGFALFIITFFLNVYSLKLVKKHRETYD